MGESANALVAYYMGVLSRAERASARSESPSMRVGKRGGSMLECWTDGGPGPA